MHPARPDISTLHTDASAALRLCTVHGLRVTVDTGLAPWLFEAPNATDSTPPDVRIVRHPVAASLDTPQIESGAWQIDARRALVTLAGVARICVTDGREIACEALEGADDADLRALLWTTAWPMLLAQRGVVALAGTAVADERGCALLLGPSGTGKTTLGLSLLRRGWRLVSDDVVVLCSDGNGGWEVVPGLPALRVSRAALEASGLPDEATVPLRASLPECWRPLPTAPAPVRLRTVACLESTGGFTPGTVTPMRGMRAYEAVARGVLLQGFAPPALGHTVLTHLSAVANRIPVSVLTRIDSAIPRTEVLLDTILEADGEVSPTSSSAFPRSTRFPKMELTHPRDRDGFFWLASFPKSGNTWMRALLSSYLGSDASVDVNEMLGGGQVHTRLGFDTWSGLKSAVLREDELEALKPQYVAALPFPTNGFMFVKVHDACVRGRSGDLMFPEQVTAGVIYLVRNPLDIAVSYAHHRGTDIDEAIQAMGTPRHSLASRGKRLNPMLPQLVLSWSGNVESWLDSGHRLLLVRYEDMIADPAAQLTRVLAFGHLRPDPQKVQAAVENSRFERLREQERAAGFHEKNPGGDVFFREGRAGGWRSRLTPAQVDRIVADHGAVMGRLGYLPLDA